MHYNYIIIDDNQESISKTQSIADGFPNLHFIASATNYDDGLNIILEHQPQLIFLEIDPSDKKSNLSLLLINELYRYLRVIPKVIITTSTIDFAFDAIRYEVEDYLLKPILINDFRKAILKLSKNNTAKNVEIKEGVLTSTIEAQTNKIIPHIISAENNIPTERPLIICVKSYGDYRYIDSTDILYFQADNNSTDIHIVNGEMITAFKTLKHFETVLPKSHFLRIHNSYIINIDKVSRIHTGNAVCYIKNSQTKLPFSKSYKENIDLIIKEISNGNYIEI